MKITKSKLKQLIKEELQDKPTSNTQLLTEINLNQMLRSLSRSGERLLGFKITLRYLDSLIGALERDGAQDAAQEAQTFYDQILKAYKEINK